MKSESSKSKGLPAPLCGIVVPMITPLLDSDTLDVEGLERLIEHILAGGVHALFILGTTGEGPSLSYRLRDEVIERTCSQVAGRVPVLVGITDTAFVESVKVASKARDAGAQALVLAHPPYFPAAQPEILSYLEHLAPKLSLPLFLYNMPSHTKLVFDPKTVRAAADIDGIVGLKDSSANMFYFHKVQMLLKDKPDFSLLVGPEELLGETVLLGGHGGVNGGGNMKPQLYVQLYNAAAARDLDKVNALHEQVMEISGKIYCVGAYSSYLRGLKCALSCMGICSDALAEPFQPFDAKDRDTIRRYVQELGLMKK
ncbi:MAG TPA: dihydrodipicolinate synthase family protein [Sedimentisphaerales bacterium]|nr:dihydrodipicolinate synthase family protein [Sedimentisphaerales bacterium]